MKKDSKSKKSSEYDEAVVKKYEKYVGKKELSKLVGAFDSVECDDLPFLS